ncbi:Flavin containing amine oxidoreductase [Carpediemonas membranifera]|uniref:Flavin containing amine oxidoreductase n=1 Tax=Carpediemonas membranifera TaxID=201153 RepID=A0A8J6BB24_9EUKA|nr:Flavin containing amine oxidoreductase [Carpediemonas membranifera]|eukprot:KAG9397004.1 Flavin containing amine oxidoreductase [Carpediemonas membranifera]
MPQSRALWTIRQRSIVFLATRTRKDFLHASAACCAVVLFVFCALLIGYAYSGGKGDHYTKFNSQGPDLDYQSFTSPILVIGAGPTGLGAAHRLQELGFDNYQVYEATDRVGGIAATHKDVHGFEWDFGPRELTSHYAYFDGLLASVLEHDQDRHTRVAWLVDGGIDTAVDFEAAAVPASLEWVTQQTNVSRTFVYPHIGGSGELFTRLAADQQSGISYSNEIVAVDPINRKVTIRHAHETVVRPYSKLVSTMPLPSLLRLVAACPHTPEPIVRRFNAYAQRMVCNTVQTVGIGVKGTLPSELWESHWYGVPDDDLVDRVSVLSNYGAALAPKGHYSLLVDLRASHNISRSDIADAVSDYLRLSGFIGLDSEVVSTQFQETCVPGNGSTVAEILADAQAWLMEHDILSRGRLGGWKNEVANIDHLFMQGVEAADAALAGVPEMTYFHPDFVNDPARGKLTGRPNIRNPPPTRIRPVADSAGEWPGIPLDASSHPGPKRCVMSIPVGGHSKRLINKIVTRFGLEQFDFIFMRYDNSDWSELPWASEVTWVDIKRQGEWWYFPRFLTPTVAEAYDYVFLWDDDIDLNPEPGKHGGELFDPMEYLRIAEKHNLQMFQPGMTHSPGWWGSKATGRQTDHNDEGRFVTFVEDMIPAFTRTFYSRVTHKHFHFDKSTGYLYDFMFARDGYRDGMGRYGVIDSTPVAHLDGGSQSVKVVDEATKAKKKEFFRRVMLEQYDYLGSAVPAAPYNPDILSGIADKFGGIVGTVGTFAEYRGVPGNIEKTRRAWETGRYGYYTYAPVLIVGAGPTGLGAAHRLQELGFDNYQVYEATDRVGGIAATHKDVHGFEWDFGPRELTSHYAYFDGLLASVLEHDQDRHTRVAWLVDGGIDTAVDFEAAAVPASLEWVTQQTNVSRTFVYPHIGGSGELFTRLAADQQSGISYSNEIVAVDPINRKVTIRHAHETVVRPYSKLVSTMLLPSLLRLVAACPHTPEPIVRRFNAYAQRMVCNTVQTVGIGVSGVLPTQLLKAHWFIVPDHPNIRRVTVLSNYGKSMAPMGHYSLLVDHEGHPGEQVEVVEGTVVFLRSCGFIADGAKIISREFREACLPANETDTPEVLADAQAWLMEHDILSRGRLGGWKNEVANIDHLFMQGVEAADAALAGVPEMTYFHPDFVNDPARGKLTGRPNQAAVVPFSALPQQVPFHHREAGNIRRIMKDGDIDYFLGPRTPQITDIPAMMVMGGSCAKADTMEKFTELLGFDHYDYAVVGQSVDREILKRSWGLHVVGYSAANRATNWLLSRLILPENSAAYRYIGILADCSKANPFDVLAAVHKMDEGLGYRPGAVPLDFVNIGRTSNTLFRREYFFEVVLPQLLNHSTLDFTDLRGNQWNIE